MMLNKNHSLVNYRGFQFLYRTIQSHSDHAPTKATIKGRIWEKKLFDIYKNLITKEDVVIDVGAYIGTHTLPFSHYAKQVIAFEPNQDCFGTLLVNLRLNDIKNVSFWDYALADKEGQEFFGSRNDGTSRFVSEKAQHVTQDVEMVKTITLDKLYPHLNGVKLLKIDVEGAEFRMLKGAVDLIERNRPHILIEVFRHKREMLNEWCINNKYSKTWLRGDDFHLEPLSLSPQ